MSKIEELPSRYKDVHTTAELISEDRAIIMSNGHYVRLICDREDDTKLTGIDFEGGPFLNIMDNLFDKKIKSIKHCYIVELE